MAVSNYDRNVHRRNKALSGVAQLKKHPADTTFYVGQNGGHSTPTETSRGQVQAEQGQHVREGKGGNKGA